MESRELNIQLTEHRVLDWKKLRQKGVARSGDTLTINTKQLLPLLGRSSVTSLKELRALRARGIKIVTEPLCADVLDLVDHHRQWIDKSRSEAANRAKAERRARGETVQDGPKPQDTDDEVRSYWQQVADGMATVQDIEDLQGVPYQRFRRRCIKLGLPWPPQRKQS